MQAILTAMNTTELVVEMRPEKKIQARTGFEPMTSAILLQWFRLILSSNVLFTLVFILRFVS